MFKTGYWEFHQSLFGYKRYCYALDSYSFEKDCLLKEATQTYYKSKDIFFGIAFHPWQFSRLYDGETIFFKEGGKLQTK